MTKISRLLHHHISTIAWAIILAIWLYINIKTGNPKLVIGNYWQILWNIFLLWDWFFWLFFACFIKCFVYKNSLFWNWKKTSLIGWMFWIFWGGCPGCSLTLASTLGLWWILSRLPYGWFELKIIWLIIIGYSLYNIWNNLESCAIKKK